MDLLFPNNNEAELAAAAKQLGYSKYCFAYTFTGKANHEKNTKTAELHGAKVAVICTPKNFTAVQSEQIILLTDFGEDPLSVLGSGKVHGLLGVEYSRITQVHCKMAIENNVAFCIGLSSLIHSPKAFDFLSRHSRMFNKYHPPLILGSFAKTPAGVRSNQDLFGFYSALGLNTDVAKKGLGFIETL